MECFVVMEGVVMVVCASERERETKVRDKEE